jgi:hypothetical protein
MLESFLQRHSLLSPIIQGGFGSALFWIILQFLQYLAPRLRRVIGNAAAVIDEQKKTREYIYRRFTSRDGLLNTVAGFQFSVSHAFHQFLMGVMFVCVALLFGGMTRVVWGICLVGALMFFGSAITWLTPSSAWMGDSMIPHWQRVAELEQELFGKIDTHTQEILAESMDAEARKKNKPKASE